MSLNLIDFIFVDLEFNIHGFVLLLASGYWPLAALYDLLVFVFVDAAKSQRPVANGIFISFC